jgi:hypothetical protein
MVSLNIYANRLHSVTSIKRVMILSSWRIKVVYIKLISTLLLLSIGLSFIVDPRSFSSMNPLSTLDCLHLSHVGAWVLFGWLLLIFTPIYFTHLCCYRPTVFHFHNLLCGEQKLSRYYYFFIALGTNSPKSVETKANICRYYSCLDFPPWNSLAKWVLSLSAEELQEGAEIETNDSIHVDRSISNWVYAQGQK